MTSPIDIGTRPPPVAIGGVGGSGTRLVAELLRSLGFHLGSDLNTASDTLWFTLLFKRLEILQCSDEEFDCLTQALVSGLRGGQPLGTATVALVRQLAGHDRPQHDAAWLRQRAESLLAATNQSARPGRWGWKEPNTHVVIERLWQRLPDLRYVHVVRNGLDMAFSSNQNQLQLWGPRLLDSDGPVTPARSLSYWCRVHERANALLSANPDRMYWLDYDAFCSTPRRESAQLCEFLGCRFDQAEPFLETVREPARPRHFGRPMGDFDPADLDFLCQLGYVVHS